MENINRPRPIDLKSTILIPMSADSYNLLLNLLNKVPSANKTEAIQLVSLDQSIQQAAIPAIKFIEQHAPNPIGQNSAQTPNNINNGDKDHKPNMHLSSSTAPKKQDTDVTNPEK